ncbi:MAG: hypothetical protein H0X40_10200 [Chthoniobacterales bacterium]|nr:hypothetical protein [Chthoniobacterales bacterium]
MRSSIERDEFFRAEQRSPGRWALSPAYDLNPVPEIDRRHTPKTAITEYQEEPAIAAAVDAAPRFGLKAAEAKVILREVFHAVSGWRNTGKQLRIKASTIDVYATAFEHPLRDEAHKLL